MIWFIFGLLVGGTTAVLFVYKFIFGDKPVGTLRIDTSDQEDGPYIFLEIDHGKISEIYKKKHIMLRVNLKNYISHK